MSDSQWVQLTSGRALNMALIVEAIVVGEDYVKVVRMDGEPASYSGDEARRLAKWIKDQHLPILQPGR
jgi:hypothetical protein